MRVVVYGATGNSGREIVKELLARGHEVVAVARNVAAVPAQPKLTAKTDDLSSVDKIAETITGADVVVSAYAPPPEKTDALLDVIARGSNGTLEHAAEYLETMKKQKRYQRDVY